MKEEFRSLANPNRVRESLHAEADSHDPALPIGRREGDDRIPGARQKWETGLQEPFHSCQLISMGV